MLQESRSERARKKKEVTRKDRAKNNECVHTNSASKVEGIIIQLVADNEMSCVSTQLAIDKLRRKTIVKNPDSRKTHYEAKIIKKVLKLSLIHI